MRYQTTQRVIGLAIDARGDRIVIETTVILHGAYRQSPRFDHRQDGVAACIVEE